MCYHPLFTVVSLRGGRVVLGSLALSLLVAAILIQVAVFSTTIFLHRTRRTKR